MLMTAALGHRTRSIEIDDSRHPLIVVTFRGQATDEEIDAYLEAQTDLFARSDKALVVVDAMEAGLLPPLQRKKLVDWQVRNERLQRACVVGTSFACRSPLVRGAITAVLWMHPLPHPYHVAASRSEAVRWGIQRLAACGLEAPVEPGP